MLMSKLCHYDQQPKQRQGKADRSEGGADQVAIGRPRAVEFGAGGDQQAESDRQQQRSNDNLVCDLFRGTSTTDRILAVTTLAYLTVTFWMWQAVRHQATIADRVITNLERPWIIVELVTQRVVQSCSDAFRLVPPFVINVQLTSTNYGRSPAWLTGRAIDVRVMEVKLPDLPPKLAERELGHIAVPNADRPHMTDVLGFEIDPVRFESFKSGAKPLVIFGHVRYLDVFEEPHCTPFCWVCRRLDTGGVKILPGPATWTRRT
jgi:hypothetical protein